MTKKETLTPALSRARERGKKQPRWVTPFLRALERTGEVEAAARDAGIDKSTAYNRRKAYPDFAAEWERTLARRSGAAEEAVKERTGFWERVKGKVTPRLLGAQDPSTIASSGNGPPPHRLRDREELLASSALGGKMVRAGPGRWNRQAEQRFFDELAASANVSRAAAAAGVSKNAVYARRLKRPDFRAKWDAVLETGRSAIEMHLVEQARKSFDPDEIEVPGGAPRVSVAEAIRIVRLHGKPAQRREIADYEPSEEEVEEMRNTLYDKLDRLLKRENARLEGEGWTYDDEHQLMIPPGWVRGPDYRPAKTGEQAE